MREGRAERHSAIGRRPGRKQVSRAYSPRAGWRGKSNRTASPRLVAPDSVISGGSGASLRLVICTSDLRRFCFNRELKAIVTPAFRAAAPPPYRLNRGRDGTRKERAGDHRCFCKPRCGLEKLDRNSLLLAVRRGRFQRQLRVHKEAEPRRYRAPA